MEANHGSAWVRSLIGLQIAYALAAVMASRADRGFWPASCGPYVVQPLGAVVALGCIPAIFILPVAILVAVFRSRLPRRRKVWAVLAAAALFYVDLLSLLPLCS